jgi:hypothetical protein
MARHCDLLAIFAGFLALLAVKGFALSVPACVKNSTLNQVP